MSKEKEVVYIVFETKHHGVRTCTPRLAFKSRERAVAWVREQEICDSQKGYADSRWEISEIEFK